MKRLLVCDFDGTLYRDGYERQFWEACARIEKAADLVFVVASGRPLHLLRPYFTGVRGVYLISNDGALITCDDQILYQKPIDKCMINQVFSTHPGTLVAHGRLLSCVRCSDLATLRLLQAQYRHHILRVTQADECKEPIYKLCLYGAHQPNELRMCYSSYALREYVAPGVHKGAAVRYLKALFGLPCTAVGDGNNDRELLQEADRSYTVAWAPPQVKAVADVIATDMMDVLRREQV